MSEVIQFFRDIDPVTKNGFFTLFGVVLGAAGAMLKDIILRNIPVKLEKIRIHDKDRIEAYKELIVFTKDLQNSTFPAAEYKRVDFKRIMKAKYESKILRNLPYYSKYIIERLEKMEDYYTCLIRTELIGDVDCNDFVEKELFEMSNEINREIKKIIKSRK